MKGAVIFLSMGKKNFKLEWRILKYELCLGNILKYSTVGYTKKTSYVDRFTIFQLAMVISGLTLLQTFINIWQKFTISCLDSLSKPLVFWCW